MENELQHTSVMPRDLTFQFLQRITNKFSSDNIIGYGGYGVVYKGVLDNGQEIAVKKLHNQHPGLDADKQFKNECTNLMRLQHENIVRLVGYCYEIAHKVEKYNGQYVYAGVEERALCFEYLQGGSLDKYLSDESCGLDWYTRYAIIKGICEGLHYLHNGAEYPIYHLDLKPANILLDKNMVPKIGDFGLSRLFDSTQTCTTRRIIGTPGYMPPEFINRYQITSKFDVFSLGIIIIKIMTGPEGYSKCGNMSSDEFIDLVYENWGKRFQGTMSSLTSRQIKTCIEIALRCVEVNREKRPTIREIVDELNKIGTEKRSFIDQGNEKIDRIPGLSLPARKKSMLVVSEFVGCSPSLSGAIRVNPWNIDSVADAMDLALEMPEGEKVLRHEKHHRYVSTHDVGYWANSFLQDLERTCHDHNRRRCWGIGFGLKFRVVALDPNFRKLAVEHLVSAYRRTTTRVILLDYDGTLMPQTSFGKSPSSKTIDMLNSLCRDKNNMVFLVSTKSRMTLNEWFAPCENLGLAAEHGYFLRLRRDAEWETCVQVIDCSWKQIAEPVMKTYTETTDGSTVEDKETAIVWNYEDADPDFGSCQAKELHDHLESVLANEPVSVKASVNQVEVKPQGVSKGLVAKRILSTMQERGDLPDFVLCIGDDRSDEDMFEVITAAAAAAEQSPNSLHPEAQVFACTVGRKPSKAKYYLDDPADIVRLIQALANVSDDQAVAAAAAATDTIPR